METAGAGDAVEAAGYREVVGELETSIQARWEAEDVNRTDLDQTDRPRRYVIGMFAYPSGDAHMGHVLVYSIADAVARLGRFKGEEVLNPLGWDAFGLPAENAAVKNNLHPARWTEQNIRTMRDEQIRRVGFSFDLRAELSTASPEFYRWTQWLFLKLYEHGQVYRADALVNWDPVDRTVLANEQVIDGRGWRSGAPIERRRLEQWALRITSFAEQLWDGLEELPGWSPRALAVQRNWIGRSAGAEIDFPLPGHDEPVVVYTTRPDTVYGVTSLTIAPEHPRLTEITTAERRAEVDEYARLALLRSEVDRQSTAAQSGVFTGAAAIHPLTGRSLPVYVGDYVLGSYGTGAIMNVPAHDQRDLAFAVRHGLPSIEVVRPPGTAVNSGPFSGRPSDEVIREIPRFLAEKGIGRHAVRYRLRDWFIGRQRFWGAPIPMLRTVDDGRWEPAAETDLPVLLPADIDFSGPGRSPPTRHTVSPTTGKPALRETDTMDTFVCSSWYAWRFLDVKNHREPWRRSRADNWMPVDYYVGGIEHANQHMIYFRYLGHFLHSIGLTPTKEPVKRFLDNGLIRVDGAKMSKSKGNAVTPDAKVAEFGADALRLYVLSDLPFERDRDWDDSGLAAKQRFLSQIYHLYTTTTPTLPPAPHDVCPDLENDPWSRGLVTALHQAADLMAASIDDNRAFQVAIAQLHAFHTRMSKATREADTERRRVVVSHVMQNYLKMLGLFAPHLADTLWRKFGATTSIFTERWVPVERAMPSQVEVPIQINGKIRARLTVRADSTDETVRAEVAAHLGGPAPARMLIVRDKDHRPRLVNVIPSE